MIMNEAFTSLFECFAHSLQLVVIKFNQVRRVLGKAFKMVASFNKSVKATEKLVKKCHKKLIGDCPTRWSSIFAPGKVT